jgi:hypothetical protein
VGPTALSSLCRRLALKREGDDARDAPDGAVQVLADWPRARARVQDSRVNVVRDQQQEPRAQHVVKMIVSINARLRQKSLTKRTRLCSFITFAF